MALRADNLSLAGVATEARRVMPLPARRAGGEDIRAGRRRRSVEHAMAFIAIALNHPWCMAAMLEVSKSISRPDAAAVLQRHALLCVRMADVAGTQFLVLLMGMALVTFRVAGHGGVYTVGLDLVTILALGRRCAGGHLRRVHVVFMREAFEPRRRPPETELLQVLSEGYEAGVLPGDRQELSLLIGSVTGYAQLALAGLAYSRTYLNVTPVAGVVIGEGRGGRDLFVPFMAKGAFLLLVLGRKVVERLRLYKRLRLFRLDYRSAGSSSRGRRPRAGAVRVAGRRVGVLVGGAVATGDHTYGQSQCQDRNRYLEHLRYVVSHLG